MVLWEKRGPTNTDETVKLALQRAGELEISHLVVASNSGRTAQKFRGHPVKVVCVTHQVGFSQPGEDEMSPSTRQELEQAGIKVYTGTHLMAGLDRACRFKFQGIYPAEIIANSLRLLGQGFKVCVEVAVMALDAGLVPHGKEIVAVGGRGEGADTAVVILPAHSQNFFDTKVMDIICLPREK